MKGPIIDWITPKGQSLTPHIPWNAKSGRGFNHDRTGALLCPAGLDWNNMEWVLIHSAFCYFFIMYVAPSTHTKLANGELQVSGDQWPIFLYADYTYDSEDPWNGLLRSGLLVSVSLNDERSGFSCWPILLTEGVQTRLHIPELRRSGTQGNAFWECPYPWDALDYKGIPCLCRYTGMGKGDFCLFLTHFSVGPLCIDFSSGVFLDWPCHGFRAFLQLYFGLTWWPGRKRWSRPADGMVESVSHL